MANSIHATSEYERITHELRANMRTLGYYDGEKDNLIITYGGEFVPCGSVKCLMVDETEFDRLCDSIDATVRNLESENASLKDSAAGEYARGYDEGYASADDWIAQHEDAMAEHGWVRKEKLRVISRASIEVTPRINWLAMADELQEFERTVRELAGDVS